MLAGVVHEGLQVVHTGVLGAHGLGGDLHASAGGHIGVHARGVGGLGFHQLAVDGDLLDALALRGFGVVGVAHLGGLGVLGEAAVFAPLLLEEPVDLLAGQLHVDQSVGEGLDIAQISVGQLAEREVSAQAARIGHGEVHIRLVLPDGPELGVGDQLAQRGVRAAVLGAVAVHRTGEGDVPGGLGDGLAAELIGGGHRIGDDRVHLRVAVAARLALGEEVHQLGLGLHQLTGGGVEGEVQDVDVVAVFAGLGHQHAVQVMDVGLVGMTGHDRCDLRVGVLHQVVEGQAGGAVRAGSGQTLVDQDGDHIGHIVLGQVLGVVVGLLAHGGPLDALDPVRADQVRHVLGDQADEGHPDAVDLLDVVGVVEVLAGLGVADVGADPREVGHRDDAVVHIRRALVELVVAQHGDVQIHGVERLDARLVLLDEAGEGGGADVVPSRGEDGVGILLSVAVHSAGQHRRRLLHPAVEVVGGDDGEVHQPLFGGGLPILLGVLFGGVLALGRDLLLRGLLARLLLLPRLNLLNGVLGGGGRGAGDRGQQSGGQTGGRGSAGPGAAASGVLVGRADRIRCSCHRRAGPHHQCERRSDELHPIKDVLTGEDGPEN